MTDYRDMMPVLDENDEMVLFRLENDLFDTVCILCGEGTANEQAYVLTDMQGPFPTSLDEVGDYDWVRAEDVDW